jgi:photosystem II stability/assembly factor-like uncharacterized protein
LVVALFAAWSSAGASTAPDWRPVAFRTAAMRDAGIAGGEGAQVGRALAIAPGDPNFMIWATDVGGLFRSRDGGANWEPANVGYGSRGGTGIAIDPHNPARVLILGSNSNPGRLNGLYLSEDYAASWRYVFDPGQPMANGRDYRTQLAFDPTTFDAAANKTRVAYWSRAREEWAIWSTPPSYPAFYRSEDGGETWREIESAKIVAGSWLAVDPRDGTLYAANADGLRRSRDRGESWELLTEGRATGLGYSPAAPNRLWVNFPDHFRRSEDGGSTWTRVDAPFFDGRGEMREITVSPSHPDRLVVSWSKGSYQLDRYASHDGGKTWRTAVREKSLNILPSNVRRVTFSFHPTNPDIILSHGGDYPALSRDGGLSYRWSASGVNNLLIGNSFNFSVIDPDVIFVGSQDYGTLLTTDGGDTWRYFAPGGKGWGGFNYGAYASTPDSLVVGESGGWSKPRTLAHSTNGGASWTVTELPLAAGPAVGYGDPRDAKVLFWGQYRSEDGGRTWTEMQGVTGVHAYHAADQSFWGLDNRERDKSRLVRSADGGRTWTVFAELGRNAMDVAVEPSGESVFVVFNDRLHRIAHGVRETFNNLPKDQTGRSPRVRSVALDPLVPGVIYVASGENHYNSTVGALRSLDGGRTWENLKRNVPLGDDGRKDGAFSPFWVRVHPKTREPWFAASCAGLWRLAEPAAPRERH